MKLYIHKHNPLSKSSIAHHKTFLREEKTIIEYKIIVPKKIKLFIHGTLKIRLIKYSCIRKV